MYIRSNIHTHTNWSDGKDSMEQVVEAAIQKGFHTIGISDHSYVSVVAEYCIGETQEAAYRQKLEEMKAAYAGRIDVLAGIEFDFDGKIPEQQYDYIIGSVHNLNIGGTLYEVDHDPPHFQTLLDVCGGDSLEVAKRYYDSLTENILRWKPDVLGHFDLLTKFSMVEYSEQYWDRAEEALKAMLPAVKVVEVNTGAMSRGWRKEAYPADRILQKIRELGGSIMVSADSHQAQHVDYAFEETVERLRGLGFTSVKEMTKQGFREVPIV